MRCKKKLKIFLRATAKSDYDYKQVNVIRIDEFKMITTNVKTVLKKLVIFGN